MGRRFLVTGGAGFIGSNFVRHVLENEPRSTVTNLDALTYAGVEATTTELGSFDRHTFVLGDIRDVDLVDRLMADHDIVVHFAAESHVDRSIDTPALFLDTNVLGTWNLVDAARRHKVGKFVHVSTDEVYGSIEEGFATEDTLLEPSSPYSASKAASDLVARSYAVTFDYPVIVTRCTNNYGPYQFPEKIIPLFVTNILDGIRVPLYGHGRNERDWLFVEDHCSAIDLLVDEGEPGEIYNIGANAQLSNLEVTRRILGLLGKDEGWVEHVDDRPGHDFRYAVDSTKLRKLGWSPTHPFDVHLEETVRWYQARQDWWRPIKMARS
jgi:dTDP-glucose 4,6-dehydratase